MEPVALWVIAGLMAVFTAWLLKKGATTKSVSDAGLVLFLLAMMASMFVSAVAYLYFPSYVVLLELVAVNMVSMSVALLPILGALVRGDKPLTETRKGKAVSSRALVIAATIALALLSEVFMGWTFAILTGAASTSGGILSSLLASMSTYWFIFTMASEMAVTLYLVGRRFPTAFRWLVAIQIGVMVFSPTAISDTPWAFWSIWGNSAVMILAIIYVFEFLFRNRTVAAGSLNYIVMLLGAYSLMMAGLFVWQIYGDVTLFVLSIVAEMVLYFSIVLDEERLASPPLESWLSKPYWAFALLAGVFVAEFFMGGVLDVVEQGTSYFTGLPFVAIGGSIPTVLGAAFYDFIIGVSSVTASFWFLAMMGVEMGALVVFKIKYAREAETKIRLGLIVGAYAIYSLFLPVFVFPNSLPNVPWIGWSMGVGTAGAVAPAIILVILATYLISGTLSFFLGSRNVCSVFCTAALMYQGTAYDAMSSFNRSSKIGRHLLTSRISNAYKVVVSLVWVSLLGSAILSYLNATGAISISFFGDDVSSFFYAFYFSFLWYLVWIMIPFVGTYGCATTGMCGWGSFNQLISRIGLFKLKVRDGDTCVNCETKDCAKVCPVGITDMPGAFIDREEFKSYKCIGVGDCVTACPYQNIYFFDVRNWVRTKLNRPLPPLAARSAASASGSPLEFKLSKESTG